MVNQDLKQSIADRIKKREKIKSHKIHNAFRKKSQITTSGRTISKALQELEEEDKIKRKGHGPNTNCIWIDN